MKTSSVRPTAKPVSKKGKPRAKANTVMENLFTMAEEDIARLFSDDRITKEEVTASSAPKSSSENKEVSSIEEPNRVFSKRRAAKTKSTQSSIMSSQRSASADSKLDVLDVHINKEKSLNSNVNDEQLLERKSSRALEEAITNLNEKDGEYNQDMTNEEHHGVTKQLSNQLSEDLSFELNDEFFVELSDLEFGDDSPLEETTNENNGEAQESAQQKDRVEKKVLQKEEPHEEDESFELPDKYAAIDDKDMIVEVPTNPSKSNSKYPNVISNDINSVDDNSNLETIEDEKFDIDELINAGRNSYSHNTISAAYKDVKQDTAFSGDAETSIKDPSTDTTCDSFYIPHGVSQTIVRSSYSKNTNESDYLPFGKSDIHQQILQAWAFGDMVALSKFGEESTLDDEPFYSGDDEDFGSRIISSKTEVATKADVKEHPLARYGLKVRTINAIEFVGEKNYYSLSEESRRDLELLIQDLSKTEEGTSRNSQLKKAIFGMFC